MSFFGFDPSSNPNSRAHPSNAPGFGATPDHFAGLSSRPDDDDEDAGIDFEDTYDGLGDGLDETDDALNDDTFGDGGAPVGKDFDFAGSTARVADVLEEEHEIFDRTRKPMHKPIIPTVGPTHKSSTSEHRHIPSLAPDMSLWGEPSAPSASPQHHNLQNLQNHQNLHNLQNHQNHQNRQPQHSVPEHTQNEYVAQAPRVPPGKKFMSLEEVEAQILAQGRSQQPSQSSQQLHHTSGPQMQPIQLPSHIPGSQPLAHFHHQIPQHTPSPGAHLPQFAPPPQEHQNYSMHQLPPHLQHMLQQNQNMLPQHLQAAVHERMLHQQFQQQMRLQPREPLQQQPPQQQQAQPQMGQNRAQAVPAQGVPLQQIPAVLPETERAKLLEEESKRLKRNHKIAQLARYNGLMTPQDKNFIQRIQLQQLVSIGNTEDNANEDFYYIVHSAIRARANPQQPLSQLAQTYLFRTGGRNNRRQDNHMQRMEQQVARAVAAAKAHPKASQLVLEGSLGKISFSNVKTPRPMLNIKRLDSDQKQATHKSYSNADRKTLLAIVETVYDVLLEVEVHERDRSKLSPPNPNGSPSEAMQEWEAKRTELAERLYHETRVLEPIDPASRTRHPFIAILSFGKMKRAIPRIFRHLNPEQRVTILTMIVVHLDVLDVVRHGVYPPGANQLPSAVREEVEMFANNVLPPLLSYVYEAPLSIVVGLLGLLLERVDVVLISKTKIGIAFLTMFFSRAELLKQSGGADEKELQDWQTCYNRFFDTLQGHWMDCFPPSGRFVDDQYVWQFLASMAVGANEIQQRELVGAVKDRVMENVQASKVLPPEIGVQKRENVNLFMRAMGLDVELLG